MRGRHAASGWSPFWRDILLRSFLVLLLVAMVVFIWWLFSEDDLFTGAVSTTSDSAGATSTQAPPTTSPSSAPSSAPSTVATTAASTIVSEPVTTTNPPSTQAPTTTIPAPLSPDELVVRVYNANGVGGVAGRTTARLEEAGYGVASPDNHELFLDDSLIKYRAGLEREAEQLRDSLIPDAVLEPASEVQDGVDMLVILGRSFQE